MNTPRWADIQEARPLDEEVLKDMFRRVLRHQFRQELANIARRLDCPPKE